MKDVAELANVGVGSVSRVLNNAPGVKASTRKRVQDAIKKLDYVRDEYARGLKTNSTQTIALILPTVWHPFFSEFAYYVEQALYKRQYKMLLCNSSEDVAKEYTYIQMVKQNKVDGIVGITYSAIDQYVSAELPFVSIDRYFTEGVSYVTSDNYRGGKIAAQELLRCGVTHPAYIGGFSKYPNETTKRRDGFLEVLKDAGIESHEIFVPEPIQGLDQLVNDLFDKTSEIDGLFCVNDLMALQVMPILKQRGLSVPGDVQIIGYDGFNLTEDQQLYITTVAQPVKEMAESAVRILMDKIVDGSKKSVVEVLPVQYRVGSTTRPIE
jgi:LacI family transcriptional regulator